MFHLLSAESIVTETSYLKQLHIAALASPITNLDRNTIKVWELLKSFLIARVINKTL